MDTDNIILLVSSSAHKFKAVHFVYDTCAYFADLNDIPAKTYTGTCSIISVFRRPDQYICAKLVYTIGLCGMCKDLVRRITLDAMRPHAHLARCSFGWLVSISVTMFLISYRQAPGDVSNTHRNNTHFTYINGMPWQYCESNILRGHVFSYRYVAYFSDILRYALATHRLW